MGGKKDERKKRAEEIAMAKDLDADMVDEGMVRAAAKLAAKPAVDNGAAELFEKKLSKEEKKELAAQKKAEREARKAAAAEAATDDVDAEGGSSGTKPAAASKAKAVKARPETKAERVQREQAQLDAELEEARVAAVRLRSIEGAYLGQIEAPTFSLSNPGGGPDLLERASYTLQRGRSYGLVGRNGCGKSTLLKAMASRRVGNIHPAVTVHYVSQEVSLTEDSLKMTPVDVVVNADVSHPALDRGRRCSPTASLPTEACAPHGRSSGGCCWRSATPCSQLRRRARRSMGIDSRVRAVCSSNFSC